MLGESGGAPFFATATYFNTVAKGRALQREILSNPAIEKERDMKTPFLTYSFLHSYFRHFFQIFSLFLILFFFENQKFTFRKDQKKYVHTKNKDDGRKNDVAVRTVDG